MSKFRTRGQQFTVVTIGHVEAWYQSWIGCLPKVFSSPLILYFNTIQALPLRKTPRIFVYVTPIYSFIVKYSINPANTLLHAGVIRNLFENTVLPLLAEIIKQCYKISHNTFSKPSFWNQLTEEVKVLIFQNPLSF